MVGQLMLVGVLAFIFGLAAGGVVVWFMLRRRLKPFQKYLRRERPAILPSDKKSAAGGRYRVMLDNREVYLGDDLATAKGKRRAHRAKKEQAVLYVDGIFKG